MLLSSVALAASPDATQVLLVTTLFTIKGTDDATYNARIKLPKGLKPESGFGDSVEYEGGTLGMDVELELTGTLPRLMTNAKVTRRTVGKLRAEIHTFPTGDVTVYAYRPRAKGGYESCKVELDDFWIEAPRMKAAVDRALQVCASLEILGRR